MRLSEEEKNGIGIALNEATLLGLELDKEKRRVGATFEVICADKQKNIPNDRRILVIFEPVGRVVASLRMINVNNSSETVMQFTADELLDIVQDLGCLPIYGWEFIDCGDSYFNEWKHKISMEFIVDNHNGFEHTIDLFQEGTKNLDIRIWFDSMSILDADNQKVSLQDFIMNGKRGWDMIYAGNQTAQNTFGVYPSEK